MKKVFVFLTLVVMIAGLPGCKVYNAIKSNSSVRLIIPKRISDPVELVFKIWGGADMVSQFVPATSKLGKFVAESEKYCTIRLTQFPKTANDTLGITIRCENDSLTKKVAGILGL